MTARGEELRASQGDDLTWRTSSYSSGQGGNCVEVGVRGGDGERVWVVRDSKERDGTVLWVSKAGWAGFVGGVQNDEYD